MFELLSMMNTVNLCPVTLGTTGTTSNTAGGDCDLVFYKLSTTLGMSASLETGMKVQYRTYDNLGSPGTWSGWFDWPGGYSGTSDTFDAEFAEYTSTSPDSTLYYGIQFRLIGTDGSTVCETGPQRTSTWSVNECI